MPAIVCNTSFQTPFFAVPNTTIVFNKFSVRKGIEGKQIIVEWDVTGASAIKIIRKQFTFSTNITDGLEVVFQNPVTTTKYYVDFNIDDKVVYYYKLFAQDASGNWFTSSFVQGCAFSCLTGFFRENLFKHLPIIYQSEDSNTSQLILKSTFATDLVEWFHINSDSNKTRGQLERFLAIFGVFLDEAKCYIDFMPILHDVDNTHSIYLSYLAAIVGVVFNFDLPIDRQRIEIKDAVATYKLKGTKEGIKLHAQKITGFAATIDEFVDNMLVTNRSDRTMLDLSNPLVFPNIGLCNEPFDYMIDFSSGGIYSFEKILICLDIPTGKSLEKRILEKLNRTLRDVLPADTIGIVIYKEENDDTYDSPNAFNDEFEDQLTITFFFTLNTAAHVMNNATYVTVIT